MTSSSLGKLLSVEEYKASLDEASSRNEHYLETGHLHIGKECLSRAKWFKGSKDRGFRGNLAAQKGQLNQNLSTDNSTITPYFEMRDKVIEAE